MAYNYQQYQQDPMWQYFAAVDTDRSGAIDHNELQRALTSSGICGNWKPFSMETCRLLIAMLDRDFNGTLNFNEFREVWNAVNMWKQNFVNLDRNMSGTIESHELDQAIRSLGYNVGPQTMNVIMRRYSEQGRVSFDDYVSCCVKLRGLSEGFRRHDSSGQGWANMPYDSFIQLTMSM
eukprot:Nk52_evm45s1569 gene=Nk52_evmTU45s1569